MSTSIVFEEFGTLEVLQVRETELPEPGAGEVRIANRAISINPADWKLVAGYFQDFRPVELPAVPGNETAGVVTAVGPGVTQFRVGDEVVWYGFTGGYSAEANVRVDELATKPANVDFDQAASLPVAAGTATAALRQIRVGAGDTVLIHGAAGGVGVAAVQLARHLGANVIGTASSRNHEYLRSLGARPVAYGPDLVAAVRDLGPITAVFDTYGGPETVAATVALLPDRARAVTAVPDESAAAAGISPVGRERYPLDALLGLTAQGIVRFPIHERIPLTEVTRALEISQRGHVRGKLILEP